MRMLCAFVDIQVVEQRATEGAFGEHTLDSVLQDALSAERLLAELCGV